MDYVLGALAGLLWGAAAAVLNMVISKKALEKSNSTALLAANLGRMAVDVAALAVVFLLRKVLPFSYEAMLIGTAVALSLVTIFFAFRLAGKQKPNKYAPAPRRGGNLPPARRNKIIRKKRTANSYDLYGFAVRLCFVFPVSPGDRKGVGRTYGGTTPHPAFGHLLPALPRCR